MNERKRKAISSLIRAPTFAAAAKETGVSESTLRRWRAEPEFSKEYGAILNELVQDAGFELRKGMSEAAQTLREIRANADAPSSAIVAACRLLLVSGLKVVEAEDIVKRLEALENAQGN